MEILFLIFNSIFISTTSIILSLILSFPIFFYIGIKKFNNKKIVNAFLNALLSIPTVTMGMLVFVLFMDNGLFGNLNILFTRISIIIGQTLFAMPIIIVIMSNSISNISEKKLNFFKMISTNKYELLKFIFLDKKKTLFISILISYNRIITEIGISNIVGGNIRYYTRTMSTSINYFLNSGDITSSVFIGLLFVVISFFINLIIKNKYNYD